MTIKQAKANIKLQEQQAAIKQLKEMLKPGDHVYSVDRHVTRSNITRYTRFYAVAPFKTDYGSYDSEEGKYIPYDGHELLDITGAVVEALEYTYSRRHCGIELQWSHGDDVVERISELVFGRNLQHRLYSTNLSG